MAAMGTLPHRSSFCGYSTWNVGGLVASGSRKCCTSLRSRTGLKMRVSGSRRRLVTCFGVADFAMDWRPAFDEVLLMSSVLLAYVAGVVSPPRAGARRPETATSAGTSKLYPKVAGRKCQDVWDKVKRKLVNASDASDVGSVTSPVLCLQGLAYGPRVRLFLVTLAHLQDEVRLKEIQPSVTSLDVICNLIGPVCRSWLSAEPLVSLSMRDLEDSTSDEAKAYVSALLNKSGKSDLYLDILFFLSQKSSRSGGILDAEAVSKFAEQLLEDLVVAIAEGAAATYLAAFGAVNTGSTSLLHSSLPSTRSLQRFLNEVALQQWMHYNFNSVAEIYEDRIPVWTFEMREEQKQGPRRKSSMKSGGMDLVRFNIRLRRINELRDLSGWRYYYSLYLEFSDIVGPLVRALVSKLGQGLSFLLVSLIGRSFGLIYQGIKDSLRWSSGSSNS